MKIRLAGAQLFHAVRRTDMAKLKVAFRNFAKAPKNQSVNVLREIIAIILRTTKKTQQFIVCVKCVSFNV
jgi:hypothetical protein